MERGDARMSLEVRLRHALGDRLVELPARPIDEPVVVGRSAAADVQVPSITVAQRHCVLFVHEGRWVLQDAGGTTGTFINGKKAEAPTLLRGGDVVTLGTEPNAPTLEIDPAGAARGKRGYVTAVGAPSGSTPASLPPQPPSPGPAPVPATTAAMVAPSHPAVPAEPASYPAAGYAGSYPAAGHFQPAAPPVDTSAGDVVVGWTADVAAPRYYSRRRRGDYSLPVAIFITLLIVGGVAYYARKHWHQSVQVGTSAPAPRTGSTAPAPVAPHGNDTARSPETIFNASEATAGPTTGAAVALPQPDPATTDPSGVPPVMQDAGTDVAAADAGGGDGTGQDAVDSSETAGTSGATGGDDPAWKQVQTARFSPDEAKAIVLFDDYARTHPGRNAADVQAYTEKAIDRIWFERIEQLFKQRDDLKANLT